jgi:hypothetical protein
MVQSVSVSVRSICVSNSPSPIVSVIVGGAAAIAAPAPSLPSSMA